MTKTSKLIVLERSYETL